MLLEMIFTGKVITSFRLSLDNLKNWGLGNYFLVGEIGEKMGKTFNDNYTYFPIFFMVFEQYFVLFLVAKIKLYMKLILFGLLTSFIS